MARKKKAEEHENHERWLVSYADFITLLFAFFVVMYSVSSVNEGKYRVLSDSLLSAFHSSPKSLEPIQVGRPSKSPVLSDLQFKSSPNLLIKQRKGIDFVNSDGEKKLESVDDIVKESQNSGDIGAITADVMLAMANLIDLGLINIRKNDLWLEIEIKSSILYKSGSAKLKASVIPIIKELANILFKFPNSIRVEGYTDDSAISSILYPSNWELSSARASSIARIFELSKILSERISVVGYGSTRPIADNSTLTGRNKNRRVIIVIVSNNDVVRIIKNNKKGSAAFPSTNKLIKEGIIEKEIKVEVEKSINEKQNTQVVQDREISIYRDNSILLEPKNTNTNGNITIVNPFMSLPIRLFSAVELPNAISIQDQKDDSRE